MKVKAHAPENPVIAGGFELEKATWWFRWVER
jgi:hypothetical protein